MDALNVMRPDVITQVTTYVPQIAVSVEQIINKGFAYQTDGPVFFDVGAFEKAGATHVLDCVRKVETTRPCREKVKARCRIILVGSMEREISLRG